MIVVTTTWTNNNPATIWNVLARKLGREPTHDEAKAEVMRILTEARVENAAKGQSQHGELR